MKTALYVRVSSDAQAEHGYSIEAQLDKLKGYCKINDIYDYGEYVDAGYTGSNLDRPEMQRLIRDIEANIIDTVVIYKLDRLSRKTKDTLYLVEDIFNKYNISFVSLAESIDTSSSSGKFFLTILSSVAQLERETIKERTLLGRRKKAENGIKSNASKTLYGYDYNKITNSFVANEYKANQIRLIYKKFIDGESITQIAKYVLNNFDLKIKQKSSTGYMSQIWRMLTNATYTGKLTYKGEVMNATNVEQIIDNETFDKVQSLVKLRRKTQTRVYSKHLLSGLLFCGLCGARLRTYYSEHKKYSYYICYSRGNNNAHMVKDKYCKLPFYGYTELNNTILNSVKNVINDITLFDKVKAPIIDYDGQIKLIENQLKLLADKANNTVDLMLENIIDKETLANRIKGFNTQRESLQNELATIKHKQSQNTAVPHKEAKLLTALLDDSPPSKQRDIIRKLIKKIVLYDNKRIEIFWNF